MLAKAKRWLGAQAWDLARRAAGNRQALYGGASGLRMLTFHETRGAELERFKRVVSLCADNFALATPADADAVAAGCWPHGNQDRLLLTFDDGFASNFDAARWLHAMGISATFFVVPSLLGRDLAEFDAFHAARGVKASPPVAAQGARGLSVEQVREMAEMGHRIGAHNFAHRDLGKLHDPAAIRYEVDNALEAVAEITGKPCEDFAIAYGQPENVSDEAVALLLERPVRVYSCHRGLNVPGVTPRFLLRDAVEPFHPLSFTRVCIEGGGDHHLAERMRLMAARTGKLPDATRSAAAVELQSA